MQTGATEAVKERRQTMTDEAVVSTVLVIEVLKIFSWISFALALGFVFGAWAGFATLGLSFLLECAHLKHKLRKNIKDSKK